MEEPLQQSPEKLVALVTCRELPDLPRDAKLLVEPLSRVGIRAVPAVWDDESIDWNTFDLAIIRSCWDYVPRLEQFLSWADGVPRLANPAPVISWNTDKRYLRELHDAGVSTVATEWLSPGDVWSEPDIGDIVVKPVVSMSSLDTGRYRMSDSDERQLAMSHVQRLLDTGRSVMIQPYMSAIDVQGETSLVYLDGELSHAVRKSAMLQGPDTGVDHRFEENANIELSTATTDQRALGERVLDNVPGGRDQLTYARIDMVPGNDGLPVLMELELTEPQLFFGHAPGSAERFASVVHRRVERGMALRLL